MKKDAFFAKMDNLGLALTYDDVRLKSGYSETMPHEISIESKFSRNVPLKIPLISAAMDTVTEHRLATEMAFLGGLGVIHRNLTPERQAAEVVRVKNHLNARIEKPTCVYEDETIEQLINKRDEEELTFHSFPVLDRENRLVGIITKNDFDFCDQPSITVKEAMTTQVIKSHPETTIAEAYDMMFKNKKKLLPLVDKEGFVQGLYVFSDVQRVITGTSPNCNTDPKGQLRVAAAIGTGEKALERARHLIKANVDVLVIDTAHGDSKPVFETLKAIKRTHSRIDVVVGNISEGPSARRLIDAGADGIKIGQGPGSICTTRIIAGIGSPQVSAVYQCSKAIRGSGIPLCADGGVRYSGDITIGIGAGADSVMMGSMLAGTLESPGSKIFLNGRQWKYYRGMGSLSAMLSSRSSRERYRQKDIEKLIPEGVEGMVPYKGKLNDVLVQYIGGLRSGMGYVGAADIDELHEKADFHRISASGRAESHPHNIQITKETPNYPGQSGSQK
tara:strand:+ start:9330 stop:10838 length:1509 start_codon:yes stop_codon:yes gene_type:complete